MAANNTAAWVGRVPSVHPRDTGIWVGGGHPPNSLTLSNPGALVSAALTLQLVLDKTAPRTEALSHHTATCRDRGAPEFCARAQNNEDIQK
jgi:hypothetical protein